MTKERLNTRPTIMAKTKSQEKKASGNINDIRKTFWPKKLKTTDKYGDPYKKKS
jgi:hypothetical protein